MVIPMASGCGLGRGFSSKLPATPMGIPLASGLGMRFFLDVASFSYGYFYGAVRMDIPMASDLGRRVSSKIATLMGSGLGGGVLKVTSYSYRYSYG